MVIFGAQFIPVVRQKFVILCGSCYDSVDDHVYYPFEYEMTPMGQNFKMCFSIKNTLTGCA